MYFAAQKLSVGYSGRTLIRDIDLAVERGAILTLIGPNGSGKSTILKTITRHLEQIAGVVTIDSGSISKLSNKELAKKLSVMLTERIEPELMTCGQVVAMGRYPYTNSFGKLTDEDARLVYEALDMVRARELEERPFSDVSDGQRQRIMLARAICQEPSVIVLDEPTSYLDIRHKIELLDILRKMAAEKNVAVIMSLHEIDLAAKISDKIVCVKGDTIETCGTPEEVFTDEFVKSLYDIESGSFNTLFGSVELAAPAGDANIFVLSGGGSGIPFFRLLQKHKRAFSTGILFENDVDFQVASVLARAVVSAEAFSRIPEEKVQNAKALIDSADIFVDAGVKIGEFNAPCGELLSYAKARGKKIVQGASELIGLISAGRENDDRA